MVERIQTKANTAVFALTPKDPNAFENAKELLFTRYPRIFLMIEAAWGTRDLHKKLSSLLKVDNVKREGFPTEICEALMTIQEQHADEFGFSAFTDLLPDTRLPDRW